MISQNRADEKRQVPADHQWQTVQEEDRQNQQLLDLSNQILELTRAIHFPAMAYWARVTLTVAGALVLLAAAWKVRHILLLVLVAAVLAVGLDPQVQWLQRRRLSRGWAVAGATVLMLQ